jgi:ATP-dependent Zn protease
MDQKVTLNDIGGYEEEKAEGRKIIAILTHFEEYRKAGAYVPKGLILAGAPGVGKTMFAEAIANEAHVPFYEFEASEDDSERETINTLKSLFEKAKAKTPSIIFIDELDELVCSDTFVSDYSRKTLKILLSEIDGVHSSSGVMVIATTNFRADLPEALIRSGRMDKKITFDLPDLKSREAIVKIYLDKSPKFSGVSALSLAKKTSGFSGADIKTLVNNALVEAVAGKREQVQEEDLDTMIPEIRFKDIKKKSEDGPNDATIYHEIGHFIVTYRLKKVVAEISCERYGGVAGYTAIEDMKETLPQFMSVHDRLDEIKIALAGLAGEKVFLDDNYCGASSDLTSARANISLLMSNGYYGFDYLPFGVKSSNANQMMTGGILSGTRNAKIEEKEVEILTSSFNDAVAILQEEKTLAAQLYEPLKKEGRLSKKEIELLLRKKDNEAA